MCIACQKCGMFFTWWRNTCQTNQGDMQYDDQMVIKGIEVQCCSVPMWAQTLAMYRWSVDGNTKASHELTSFCYSSQGRGTSLCQSIVLQRWMNHTLPLIFPHGCDGHETHLQTLFCNLDGRAIWWHLTISQAAGHHKSAVVSVKDTSKFWWLKNGEHERGTWR